MMLSKAKHGIISFLFCSAFFFVILFFCHPIYNSGDDVYLLYLLGGGFGEQPTNLLHYNFGMHPWLGWLIKNFFIQFPGINWYSVVLYALHFISCCILLRIFLATKKFYDAILIFLVAFFVFESQFLLNLTFSNTALITAMTGIILLLHETGKKTADKKIIPASLVLIVISIMLRLHTLVPLALLSAPIIIFRFFQKRFLLLCTVCIACIIIFFLNYFQEQYYSNKIPGWKTEEAYRQTVLSYYNIPKNLSAAESGIAKAFLDNGLFWDKEFLSADKIQEAIQQSKTSSSLNQNNFREISYWLFINSRIFWFLLLVILIMSMQTANKTDRILNFSCLLIMLSSLAFLLFFKKLPFYLVPGLILFYILLTTVFSEKETNASSGFYRIYNTAIIFLMIAVLAWSLIRVQKTISFNKEKNASFLCAWKEINTHADKLFIVTDDHFPMDYFFVWDLPKKFVIKNLLYKDELLNNTYQPIFNRFAITGPKDFINNPNIIFVGIKITEIENYYKEVWKAKVHFTEKDTSFSCIEVHRLSY